MSHKKKYKSVFGAGMIYAADYLVEQILLKRATKKGLKLPHFFWRQRYADCPQHKYWAESYKAERKRACNLLNQFDEDCVIKALSHYECKTVLSLFNGKFERVARDLQDHKKLVERTREQIVLQVAAPNTLPRKKLSKKSKLGRLT